MNEHLCPYRKKTFLGYTSEMNDLFWNSWKWIVINSCKVNHDSQIFGLFHNDNKCYMKKEKNKWMEKNQCQLNKCEIDAK